MNLDTIKIEIIDWLAGLNDQSLLNKILNLKKEKEFNTTGKTHTKIFGSGKDLIEYISDDFNDPIDEFNDYQK